MILLIRVPDDNPSIYRHHEQSKPLARLINALQVCSRRVKDRPFKVQVHGWILREPPQPDKEQIEKQPVRAGDRNVMPCKVAYNTLFATSYASLTTLVNVQPVSIMLPPAAGSTTSC